jgi:hypothetical protein
MSWIHPLQSIDCFSAKSPSLSTHFFTFVWYVVCQLHKTPSWSVEGLDACCASVLRCPQDGSQRVLNQVCRKDEGEESTLLLQLPSLCADWCVAWHCHVGGGHHSSYCLAKPIRIHCFDFFNVCTCHSELMVAPVSKNHPKSVRSPYLWSPLSLQWLVGCSRACH